MSAIRAFSARGFYGARIEDIVAGADVNVRMIYHYFGSKEGLYDEAVLSVSKTFFQLAINAIQSCNGTGVERLERAMTAYGLAVLTHPEYARMMVWERTSGSETVTRVVPTEEDVEDLFESLIKTALSERPSEEDLDAKLMASLCAGAPFLLVSQGERHGFKPEQTTAMMETVWRMALKASGLTTDVASV